MKNSNILNTYIEATEMLCQAFYEKYYLEEDERKDYVPHDDWYVMGGYKNMGPDAVGVGDQFWDLSDMYTALVNDMDRDIVLAWYDEYIDEYDHTRKNGKGYKQWVNLWHYWLRAKNKPIYTEEELEASKKAVDEAHKLFMEELEKYNIKK